ncbi:MAG: MMPL family transporter [Myxococcales bacterium]|nr:MMPL family transporter [Myxococcales bacterium]
MLKLPERPVRRLVEGIAKRPYLTCLAALAVTALALLSGRSIELRSRIEDLLPGSAPSVQAMEVLEKRLGSADILVVALMTDDFEKVKPALPAIAAALEADPDVASVRYRQDVTMIDKNALIIFPTLDELHEYYDDLTENIRREVSKRMDLGLDDDDEAPAEGKKDEKAEEFSRYTFDWAEHEQDDGLSNLGRTFREERGEYREYFYNRAYTTIGLQVYPVKGSGDLAFCKRILATVDEIVRAEIGKTLGPVGPEGVVTDVILGGGYRNALEQSDQIKGDMASSVGVSFILLALVVMLFFRSIRAFVCVFLPLVCGVSWTVGLVALTVGYLNLITAFIFAVLLGLGIDFGIHFYGRYREERATGHDAIEAMVVTHLHCGEASILAAATTAASFLALTIADFKGFSQFGGVAACGVLLCLLAVFIVFTAMIFVFERWFPLRLLGYSVDREVGGDIPRRPFPIGKRALMATLVLALGGVALSPMLRFEMDFNRLGQKEKEKRDYEKVIYGTTQATSPAVIFTQSPEEGRFIYEQLEQRTAEQNPHPRIKSYQSVFSLIPDHQEEKTQWVRKICRKLARKVKLFEGDKRDGADELLRHCEPAAFSVDDLPDWVKAKFSDRDGRLGEFIFVSPRGSTSDGEVALAFRDEMVSLKGMDGQPPLVSGKPMIWADVLRAMEFDGLRTTAASLLTVLLLLYLFERRVRAVALIALPLSLALAFTGGLMVLLGIKLNFFNMLAIPTVIGMGVDDGVHLYHRYKELGRFSARYIVRTTGMSAVLTTLTTAIGFGSLLLANHYGLNSLGVLSMIAMGTALAATLLALPAAMQWNDQRLNAREAQSASAGRSA